MKYWTGIAFGVLAFFTILFAYMAFSWKSEALRLQKENGRTKKALEMQEASAQELRQNVQAAIDSQEVAGVYIANNHYVNGTGFSTLDLRTDGTVIFDEVGAGYGGARFKWYRQPGSILKTDSNNRRFSKLTIEGVDLIDAAGVRWLRQR